MAGRILLRLLLAQELGGTCNEWKLSVGSGERPRVQGRSDCHLSVAHSGDWVSCAVSSQPVGVDVEVEKTHWQLPEMFSWVCPHLKWEDIQREVAEADRVRLLLIFWTMKEDCFKKTGEELHLQPPSISLQGFDKAAPREADAWSIYQKKENRVVSVVAEGKGCDLKWVR